MSDLDNKEKQPEKSKLKRPTQIAADNKGPGLLKVPKEKTFKATLIDRRRETMQKIEERKKDDRTTKGVNVNKLNKYKNFVHLDFPIEGKLIIYLASNYILAREMDQATRVLTQYGLSFYLDGNKGICNKANVQKLLALAYFMQDQHLNRVESLLAHA